MPLKEKVGKTLVQMKRRKRGCLSFSLSVASGVFAFAVLKQGVDAQYGDVSQQLKDAVSKKIAKYASPDRVQVILSDVQDNRSI